MKTSLVRNIFAIFGLISFVFFISAGSYLVYKTTFGNTVQINKATKKDVKFILNWCELGDDKIERVVNSYVSQTGFTADHLDAYLIKVKDIDIEDLSHTKTGKWYRGDNLPDLLHDAVKFSTTFNSETPWFLNNDEILSSDSYIYPWYIGCNEISPSSVKLIILKPNLNLIYFKSVSI